ncbi:LysR family transcriptional regulator [Ferrimonas lipolytica]|uniref:LysR family transcriptional regulator n=1 Tax=Ferrimonas lipolytica TaxID=2724191 RepID=A0A6H1UDU8_9GAMM|nr:LysR family transcriptional regulator [Ferrimonas lipolytica]QIZ76770.1 LysR family transcriptional regulator [Ferrimonas lipolytica]
MVNLDWLQTFCTLVETRHFTRTAEKLAMTQPGVSQQIRKLEQHFQQPLLLREGKKFTLTEAGHQVYRQARQSLIELAQLEYQLGQDDPHIGRCRIASPGSVGLKLYPVGLELQRHYPQLQIEYQFAPNDGIERMMAERQLDIGLMTRITELPELHYHQFASEPLCLVTPPAITDVSWKSLMSLGYIDHPDGRHHTTMLLGANYPQFEQIEQFPRRGFSNQIGLLLEPVALGLGFTVLPLHATNAFSRQDKITIWTLPNPVEEQIYLVKRRYQVSPSRIELLQQQFATALNGEL